jgi:A/G-specific adenine glycosylase
MKGASARQVTSTVPKTNAQVDVAVDVDVADIEELCGLCESVPGALTVEAFPMRAEKKKAREETDTVRVIEWRARPNADVNANAANRWFLLVKRPEGGEHQSAQLLLLKADGTGLLMTLCLGLLGGLEEFPSEANVVDDDDSTDEESAHTAIQRLLVDTIAPASSPKAESTARADTDKSASSEQLSNPLHVARFTCVGDVQHIFSHIRKTYRVQWVVLQGGGDAPPDIRPQSPSVVNGPRGPSKAKSETSGRALKKRRSVKGKDTEDATTSTSSGSRVRWIPMEQVSDAK